MRRLYEATAFGKNTLFPKLDDILGSQDRISQRLTGLQYQRAMTQALGEHHRRIATGIIEIQKQCRRSDPDTAALGAARLHLSRASSARSQYLREVLIPKLQTQADKALLERLDDMQRSFVAKRLASSEHVTTWSSKTITEDWDGYRRAARLIWAMMEEQMTQERQIFG